MHVALIIPTGTRALKVTCASTFKTKSSIVITLTNIVQKLRDTRGLAHKKVYETNGLRRAINRAQHWKAATDCALSLNFIFILKP